MWLGAVTSYTFGKNCQEKNHVIHPPKKVVPGKVAEGTEERIPIPRTASMSSPPPFLLRCNDSVYEISRRTQIAGGKEIALHLRDHTTRIKKSPADVIVTRCPAHVRQWARHKVRYECQGRVCHRKSREHRLSPKIRGLFFPPRAGENLDIKPLTESRHRFGHTSPSVCPHGNGGIAA
jgi:hypothetical protein